MPDEPAFIPLALAEFSDAEMVQRAESFRIEVSKRRTVRDFSSAPVSIDIINQAILAANSAPSGANMQPWHFAVVSSPEVKKQIRIAAEEEEREFYNGRASEEWLNALTPFGTDANKPFLETAPHLIAIFLKKFEIAEDGEKRKTYYPTESIGIATGILITALHQAGLATLTHTPSPMKFLNSILDRSKNERPFLLLVVGHPAKNAQVPAITRKSLDQITSYH